LNIIFLTRIIGDAIVDDGADVGDIS